MWSEHCSYKSSTRPPEDAADRGAAGAAGARARTRAPWTSATAWPRSSRSSRTTTRRSSSPTRARPPASAASCATSSRWARGPIALLNSLRFGPPDRPAEPPAPGGRRGGHRRLRQRLRLSDGRRRGRLRALLRRQPARQRVLPRPRQDRRHLQGPRRGRRQPRLLRRAPRPAATASTARPWPRPSSARAARRSGPPCRSAIPSWRRCCSRPASRSLKTGARRRHPGHGRGRPHLLDVGDGSARRARASRSTSQKVPQRETGHDAPTRSCSPSRRSGCCSWPRRGARQEVDRVFEKWDLHAEAIGTVTAEPRLRVFNARTSSRPTCRTRRSPTRRPLYDRPWVEPVNPAAAEDVLALPPPGRPRPTPCCACSPRPPSRASAGSTGSTTARCAPTPWSGPGSDAAVVRVKGTTKALAMAHRRQRPLLLARSLRGRAAGRGRGLPQRGGRGGRCPSAPPTA